MLWHERINVAVVGLKTAVGMYKTEEGLLGADVNANTGQVGQTEAPAFLCWGDFLEVPA